MTTLLGALSL